MEVQIQTAQGVLLGRVARRLGIDRKTARKLRDAPAEPTVTVRRRRSRIEEHCAYIEHRLAEGGERLLRTVLRTIAVVHDD